MRLMSIIREWSDPENSMHPGLTGRGGTMSIDVLRPGCP